MHEYDLRNTSTLFCVMRILTIVGPTAVGKTRLAIEVAKRISGEIISADSRQIYKQLDIGTAKPTTEQRRKTKFHLIDFVEPDEDYSCGQFARDAEHKIDEIAHRKNPPVICGGTGLYIRALFHPLDDLPKSDKKTKRRLLEMLEEHGIAYMYTELQRVDPQWAKRITPRDKQRILRGLEVYEMTGKPMSRLIGKRRKTGRFLPYYIGMTLPRDVLYERINHRFDQMIEQRLVNEVQDLLKRGLNPETSALRTIGYKEIAEHLNGDLTLDEAIDKAKRRTRNYAKRQITWFSRIPDLAWHSPQEPGLVDFLVNALGS
ncbi:tRNA (adenosine(37)-N6)-dimethylallyltransferase MiaA [candidate division WOR-3 bacterium]|nr:tRNA (adenosine(37)-N6)-dimethylallyltransferase MiaA [candidate division WOR-3 bacterium]